MLNLPVELTPFIGRVKELDELAQLLADPNCRLITLVGPGGSGKTRLAIEAARNNATPYSDGVHFVGLQPISSGAFLIPAIADALHYSLRGADETAELIDYIHDKNMLLVLDNFEHLLSAVERLNAMLVRAPMVKLLVTSREVLNLREEWLYALEGMSFPTDADDPDLENYGAVQLFAEHARRVRRDFSLADERQHVVRLCQLVEGNPLALELAASWLKSLSCSTIIHEIEDSPDFLNSTVRNLPIRHRSMRAVFEQSWKLLTEDERHVFKCLSIFHGGFHHKAAEQIAGASLPMLSALVDKSLLRRESSGRYQLHELLRQYAAEQLAHSPDDIQQVHDTHADYYLGFLGEREPQLNSARQREALQEIEMELDNIRAAWQRAVQQGSIASIQKGAFAYYALCDMSGRYHECLDALEKASKRLEEIEPSEERDCTLALMHTGLIGLYVRLGRFEEGRAAFHKTSLLYQQMNRRPPPGFATEPLSNMGLLATTVGDYSAAVTYCEEALQRTEPDDKLNLMFILYVLATSTYSLGQSEAAFDYAQKAYKLSDSLGDAYFSSYILIVMGNIAQSVEDYDRAWEYYRTSYTLKKYFNDSGGMAFALNGMGRIAWLRRDFPTAQKLYQQGYDLYRQVNDPGGIATSLLGLGETAQARADYTPAQAYFQQAIKIATQIQWTPLILAILTAVSEPLARTGDVEQAAEFLKLVIQHPAVERLTKIRAQQTLAKLRPQLDAETLAASASGNPYDAAIALQDRLAIELKEASSPNEQLKIDIPVPKLAATDALSERELEILRLLAEGLTNQQIAEKLVLVIGTVKAHNHHIFDKLGVSNRVQAITRARELGLL